jgi:hypothetical protein
MNKLWRIRPKTVLVTGGALAVIAFAVLIVLPYFELSGVVSGVEFSPDRFCHRSFRYFSVFGVQVSPTRTREWRSRIDEYLHANGFVQPSVRTSARWCLVKGFAPGVRGWHGGAKDACQALGCWGGNDKWIEWSDEHPELANVLWPQVVSWMQEEKFVEVTVLFRFEDLECANTTQEIEDKLDAALKTALL